MFLYLSCLIVCVHCCRALSACKSCRVWLHQVRTCVLVSHTRWDAFLPCPTSKSFRVRLQQSLNPFLCLIQPIMVHPKTQYTQFYASTGMLLTCPACRSSRVWLWPWGVQAGAGHGACNCVVTHVLLAWWVGVRFCQGCSVRGSAKSSGSQIFTHFNEFEKCRSEFGQISTNS